MFYVKKHLKIKITSYIIKYLNATISKFYSKHIIVYFSKCIFILISTSSLSILQILYDKNYNLDSFIFKSNIIVDNLSKPLHKYKYIILFISVLILISWFFINKIDTNIANIYLFPLICIITGISLIYVFIFVWDKKIIPLYFENNKTYMFYLILNSIVLTSGISLILIGIYLLKISVKDLLNPKPEPNPNPNSNPNPNPNPNPNIIHDTGKRKREGHRGRNNSIRTEANRNPGYNNPYSHVPDEETKRDIKNRIAREKWALKRKGYTEEKKEELRAEKRRLRAERSDIVCTIPDIKTFEINRQRELEIERRREREIEPEPKRK